MNFDFQSFMEAAPYLLLAYVFLKDKKLFVTPSDLTDKGKEILKEVEEKFLSLLAFNQFEKRIEGRFEGIDNRLEEGTHRFDKVDTQLEHIIELLVKEK